MVTLRVGLCVQHSVNCADESQKICTVARHTPDNAHQLSVMSVHACYIVMWVQMGKNHVISMMYTELDKPQVDTVKPRFTNLIRF